ncbi:argininosuccinate lyase isoform X2 [Hyalella azteca]|uniref:Argininosuccinate lyase isoform X2 n=1 Tax=Hyalella azteca TaxID=294128 RepID=A0A8B7N0Q0_HYAAZ|nr:argininosuccinate lyase isoform X2 [Hyalella azteca]
MTTNSTGGNQSDEGKLWGGRFTGATDPIMERFNSSLQRDKIMFKEDIQGSIAYSRAIERAGLLTAEEATKIRVGLESVLQEWTSGSFVVHPSDEDIHTANERRLKELIGEVGGKLHTGRSRNDQVATDTRLWLRSHLGATATWLLDLIKALLARAEDTKHVLCAGYTHLQRAQPVRFAHWLLSFAWWLRGDLRRLEQCYTSTDQCPLGCGALAGNPFNIDRKALAADLGFSSVMHNSMMAVADRDFVADYLYFATMLCSHLSRLSEDLSLYSSAEFGYEQLADAYSTGSSLMPQKKNPDSVELVRGKAATFIGRLTGFLCVLKGLPSTYNKDLQEDKEALFDVAFTLTDLLGVLTGVVTTMRVNTEACRAALSESMLATDIAYYLVRKGMAFRTAHGKAGEVVKLAEELQKPFSSLSLDELRSISPLFTADVSSVWSFESSVEQYSSDGGTGMAAVARQMELLHSFVESFKLGAHVENFAS